MQIFTLFVNTSISDASCMIEHVIFNVFLMFVYRIPYFFAKNPSRVYMNNTRGRFPAWADGVSRSI